MTRVIFSFLDHLKALYIEGKAALSREELIKKVLLFFLLFRLHFKNNKIK